ncbi:sterile alpha motif domain-containing protein 9 isoform X2 [Hippocampus comes]|uniref:sterile alpha motif domain-containing protein 9 isoform X2 n=1 Tax=Hippocampus comes TaxID=109280 RepID=UPI00094EE8EB|nr:PREDICTED: sterile alpha motif domain-containing protein 9-like isoform X2 [Hippocampus comes]
MSVVSDLPADVGRWTSADICRWLKCEVRVGATLASKLAKEVECGQFLLTFDKQDILELGIKHGPAVLISRSLERLKKGERGVTPPCGGVETWSARQVFDWLLPQVPSNPQYAKRLLQEDVSGRCLLCFGKKDFVDIGVRTGPAVHILKKVSQLKEEAQSAGAALDQGGDRSGPQKETQKLLNVPLEGNDRHRPKRKQIKETAQPAPRDVLTVQKILEDLGKEDLKKFQFVLRDKRNGEGEPTPWGKLEGRDTVDTAEVVGEHHADRALQVTGEVLRQINQHDLAGRLDRIRGQTACCSEEAERKRELNQGEKLKDLLTVGGNSLDSDDRFVVVVNKSSPEQIQHLHFLSKLPLFCVLDFDPNSNGPLGLCRAYKETRVANLHSPSQYQGRWDSVAGSLNLFDQTSWVFCNGRHDIPSDANKELDYRTWFKKSCKDVEQLVALVCGCDFVRRSQGRVIFLLLSPVDTDKDPFFETYRSFLKHTEEQNIMAICESAGTYGKWKELIADKFDFDIDPLSVYELSLSQVNGTVAALGPHGQSPAKLLPSSDSSAIVLRRKDEDLMTALDVLCLNQCENVYEDEKSPEFADFRTRQEEEFYRGGKVTWWNFYFCDKDSKKTFVKRDKYSNVMRMIRSQQREKRNACVQLNFYHHPGCGATTLAMHVMWDLRGEFRCAVLRDTKLPKEEIADQIIQLMKLESARHCPVLLLVDDAKEPDNPHDLVNCVRKAVEDLEGAGAEDAPNCKVTVLNCVRSHSPKSQYKHQNSTQCQYLTASLTPHEQSEFEKKLEELQETHEKPENFYTFMIMKMNFDPKYIDDVAHNTLSSFDAGADDGKLFSFLALLNNYVAESGVALSLCEDFFGVKMTRDPAGCVLDEMKLYTNVLIVDRVEECGGYKRLRILHHTIAAACLEVLERRHFLKVGDITLQMLHYDLFFSDGVVKDRLAHSIKRMLIRRQRKKDGGERELFSPLIDKIHQQQGGRTVQDIFVKASSRFPDRASVPQALARYLYINERDFPEALRWAEKAKNIAPNPYTIDTVAQVYKSNLRSNMDREKQELSRDPDDLDANLRLAANGIRAFQRAQEQSDDNEDDSQAEHPEDESGDFPRKGYNIYGHVGVVEMSFIVFEVLAKLPFFHEREPMKKKYLQSFLGGSIPIDSVHKDDDEVNARYVQIIKDHQPFLLQLKPEVKKKFDFLNRYFTHTKGNFEFDTVNHRTVCDHFQKYVDLFCTAPEELRKVKEDNPKLKLKLTLEERRVYLEKRQADTFSGVLQHLDRPADEVEKIVESYAVLQQTVRQKQNIHVRINYILANVVLYLLRPKSKLVKGYLQLRDLLLEALQAVGLHYNLPDPYYLALLFFWPTPSEENSEIRTYLNAIRSSSRKHLSKLFHKRSTVAHLYLGRGTELKRLVSKPSLDSSFLPKMPRDTLAQLWWNGDIFKEKDISDRLLRVGGTIEQGEVFANYGGLKIPVHPARRGGIRSGCSTEKVSFYLGFAINGPLAYDVRYEN